MTAVRGGGRASGVSGESGQALVLALLVLALVLLALLGFVGVGGIYSALAETQAAADAAALAAAKSAGVDRLVDARGYVYCERLRLDPDKVSQAARAYWSANAPAGVTLVSFDAGVGDDGVTVTVTARVRLAGFLRSVLGLISPVVPEWTVSARALAALPSESRACPG